MKLAQLFSDFEEELIRQGEEAESLSFVYRSLKNLSLRTFVFALQQEVTEEEEDSCKKEFFQQLSSSQTGTVYHWTGRFLWNAVKS